MSKYDFTTAPDRSRMGSAKWRELAKYGVTDPDVVPFSAADMEFYNAPEIIEGLQEYVGKTVMGYTLQRKEYTDAVVGWMKRRHDWEIQPEWIQSTPGVVFAFFAAIAAYCQEGDGVILTTPVYYPMYNAVKTNGCELVENPLVIRDGKYEIDFDDLEEKAKRPEVKAYLMCSPHNPVGRVWTKEELERVGRICIDNDVVIISDEIHNDLILPGYTHTVFAAISEEFAQHSIILTAPSKTFNLAGLSTSNVIIPNEDLREKFKARLNLMSLHGSNMLGLEACRLAYEKAENWLDECIQVIDKNRQVVENFFAKEFPDVTVYRLEGTYLIWFDMNCLGIESRELGRILREDCSIFLDDGHMFGEAGAGYQRWNLACPTYNLEKALERLKKRFK